MGYRDDDILDEDRADAQMRRALDRARALDQLAPPPDLVTRSARRLPSVPPAVAASQIARGSAIRFIMRLAIMCALALLVVFGLAGLLGGGAMLARLFGDGSSGLSRGLLMVQLLAKPLWHSLGIGGVTTIVSGLAALAAAAWLWWWALRRTPIFYTENAP